MASQPPTDEPVPGTRTRRPIARWIALVIVLVIGAGLTAAWLARERIAGNVIAGELERRGIAATYEIESIGARRQVLRNIVVGDPDRPDLTIARAVVAIVPRFGIPSLGRITLVRPRLYGTYIDGQLSFGALDPLIFRESDEPPGLPDLDLAIEDGRALLESDFGPVGVKATGRGNLRDSFVGELAATAPALAGDGCSAQGTSVYGRVVTRDGRPEFTGPLRLTGLRCPDRGLALRASAVQLKINSDVELARIDGEAGLRLGAASVPQAALAGLTGDTRFTWRDGGLTARFDLAGRDLASGGTRLARLGADGTVRARDGFARLELDTRLSGEGLRLDETFGASLASAGEAMRGTLLGPLLERIRETIAAEGRGSRLAAALTLRRVNDRLSVVMPNASVTGGSGRTLLALSRFQLGIGADGIYGAAGNFATGGAGLPQIAGRLTQRAGGGIEWRGALARYEAGGSSLAIPQLVLQQQAGGGLTFTGDVLATGVLPGGRAEGLRLPLSGSVSPSGEWALWRQCTEVRFDGLEYANLSLERRALTICPQQGAPIVRYGAGGLRIAAGAPALQVSGRLGQTPIAVSSGAIGFAYPGALSARQLDITLGPPAGAQRFLIADLDARIGEDIAGRFTGADVRLFSVPLDVLGATGDWRYAGGRLALSNGAFTLQDRQDPDRFDPLVAREASLALADNLITATALLREPVTDREITQVALRHDLTSGRGSADLEVAGITFDQRLQPAGVDCLPGLQAAEPRREGARVGGLTCLAFGIVANVRGTVTGSGRIDWGESGVTSTGRFSSEALDFAAAFGPVRGASGTIEFSDLLGLTTAPNQRLQVASVNPGIEVNDGEVGIEVRGGEVLAVQGGSWPFMGGTLTMRPVEITFGAAEERRYVLDILGLDAGRFIERLELNNISASGVFDGTVPIVFGADGIGRVEGGVLVSRLPGGNISYVGALTYEDLSPIANYAFAALRSLDYRQMRVTMDGNLTGQIITRVRFDGVSQGEGATRNFVTRAIAGLPIRFDVNITAPFYSLLSSVRAMYDPSAIRDPRELGLIDALGNPIRRETDGPAPPPIEPDDLIPDEPAIQRRESEEMP